MFGRWLTMRFRVDDGFGFLDRKQLRFRCRLSGRWLGWNVGELANAVKRVRRLATNYPAPGVHERRNGRCKSARHIAERELTVHDQDRILVGGIVGLTF